MGCLIGAIGGCGEASTPSAGGTASPVAVSTTTGATPTATTAAPETATSLVQASPRSSLRSAQIAVDRAYVEAIARPGDQERVARLLSWYTPSGLGHKAMLRRMRLLAADGYAGRSGPKGYQVIEAIHVSADGTKGAVTLCTYDDAVIYDTTLSDANGVPVVVNDDTITRLSVMHWVRRNNAWRQTLAVEMKDWPDTNHCPAKARS